MVVERLSFAHVEEPTIIACEHLQRYEWAAALVGGKRVLDLCCGAGFGSLMLASTASEVVGVDVDADSVAAARKAAAGVGNASFEADDALDALVAKGASFDAIVCFEGLEHLARLEAVADQLVLLNARGARLLLSVPNSRMFEEENEFHVTDFELDSALRLFDRFEAARVLYQYVAEGALLAGDGVELPETATTVFAAQAEPAYASTFVCATNVSDDEWRGLEAARMRLKAAPVHTRWMRNLEAANGGLWNANRTLGRQVTELSRQLAAQDLPLSALRLNAVPAGSLVGRLAHSQHETALRKRIAELEQELRARVDELTAEVLAVGDERNEIERQYSELRGRRTVKVALMLSRLRRGRR